MYFWFAEPKINSVVKASVLLGKRIQSNLFCEIGFGFPIIFWFHTYVYRKQ